MRRSQAIRLIEHAARRAAAEIARNRGDGTNKFARGLAGEGYAGGYQQALYDVLLVLRSGDMPNTRDYWEPPSAPTPAGDPHAR